ncbi:MAG TPA: hypothetical protein VFD33_04010 [Bacillota bacterium]|nr:hypothetical protein [Bacillota bacterium]
MKKFMVAILVVFMALSLFACSGKDIDEPNNPAANDNGSELDSSDSPSQDDDEPDHGQDVEEPSNDPEETDSGEADPGKTNSGGTAPADISPVASSKEAPAKIGDWLETMRYSAVGREDHTVYYRITNIIRYNDQVQTALDAWNDADHLRVFDPLEADELEYCMIEYEVYYPEDFPQEDWGISSVDIGFSVVSPTGGGIEANGMAYIGLSSVYDISDKPEINEFYAGQTFTDGRAVFIMVEDVADYVVETSYFPDDSERVSTYVEGK